MLAYHFLLKSKLEVLKQMQESQRVHGVYSLGLSWVTDQAYC